MSFLAPKQKATPQVAAKVPVEAEVIRNPLNKAKGRRSAGAVPSILTAGLAGQLGGKVTLGG